MILKSRYLLAGLALLSASVANAGITLGGTRLIYAEKSKEASILIKNDGAQDIMIQSWLDPESGDKDEDVPFALTPALSRLAGNKQQTLRVFYFGKGLPADKESVFWLSVQEIPQKAEGNTLQIALRQRIKLFFRPANLVGSPQDAISGLKWQTLVERDQFYLQVTNNSPYFVSFGEAKVVIGGKSYPLTSDMLAPNSTSKFLARGAPSSLTPGVMTVEFFNINDYGAPVNNKVSISG